MYSFDLGGYPAPVAIEQDLVLHTELFPDIQEEIGVDLWTAAAGPEPLLQSPGEISLPEGHCLGWAVTEEHTEHSIRIE